MIKFDEAIDCIYDCGLPREQAVIYLRAFIASSIEKHFNKIDGLALDDEGDRQKLIKKLIGMSNKTAQKLHEQMINKQLEESWPPF